MESLREPWRAGLKIATRPTKDFRHRERSAAICVCIFLPTKMQIATPLTLLSFGICDIIGARSDRPPGHRALVTPVPAKQGKLIYLQSRHRERSVVICLCAIFAGDLTVRWRARSGDRHDRVIKMPPA